MDDLRPRYFYLLAGLFSLTGPNLLYARVLGTLLRFALTMEVYALARRLTSRWVALIPWVLTTFWLSSVRYYSYPAFSSLAGVLLAALFLLVYFERGTWGWLFATGAACGLAACLRQDLGGYAWIAAGLAAACFRLLRAREAGSGRKEAGAVLLREVAWLLAGAAAVAGPLYGYLAVAAGPGVLYEQLFRFPATIFRENRSLPLPGLLALGSARAWGECARLYVPLAIFGWSAIFAARRFLRPREGQAAGASILVFLAVA